MLDLATPLPCRRPELVARPFAEGGYLIRNRRAGESFQLGPTEHFLLAGLDGRQTAEGLCAAFAEHFGEPLTPAELEDFLDLARQSGFLQPEGTPAPLPPGGNGFPQDFPARPLPQRPANRPRRRGARRKQLACWVLRASEGVLQRLAGLLSAAALRLRRARLKHLEFVPRPDDVFIVTYPRSGTTWMQMILYQLTTDGSMDFPHIAEYCPWFEKSQRGGRGFETRPSPRLFKSHLAYRDIPRGPCKYVYVARNGKDVAVSYYHLYRSYNGFEGTFADFFDLFMRGKVGYGSWFAHVKGWWAHRHDPNVLFLTYGELTRDLEGCVLRLAAFCGFEAALERLQAILQRCSVAFMKQHESQLDPALESLWEAGVKLSCFLRNGRVGEGAAQLDGEHQQR